MQISTVYDINGIKSKLPGLYLCVQFLTIFPTFAFVYLCESPNVKRYSEPICLIGQKYVEIWIKAWHDASR